MPEAIAESHALPLLAELRKGKASVSVCTTYAIDFAFYESVVLRQLRAAGCERNVLLVDAKRCAEALASSDSRPRHAGTSYSLVPVHRGGAFHPKLLLLCGKKESRLWVGSHNLTVPGFGGNAEITNALTSTSSAGEAVAISDALDAIDVWLPDWATVARDAVGVARSLQQRSSVEEPRGTALLCSADGRPSLWDQVRPYLPADTQRITVLGPFVDPGQAFLRALRSAFPTALLTVAVDPHYGTLTKPSVDARYVNVRGVLDRIGLPDDARVHAKGLLFEAPSGDVLLTGSANPSHAAWLDIGRNAEAVLVRRGLEPGELGALHLPLENAPELTETEWACLRDRAAAVPSEEARDTSSAFYAIEEAGVLELHGAPQTDEAVVVFAEPPPS